MPGVRERANKVGAQVKLRSEPGAGTEVELTVPPELLMEHCIFTRACGCFEEGDGIVPHLTSESGLGPVAPAAEAGTPRTERWRRCGNSSGCWPAQRELVRSGADL